MNEKRKAMRAAKYKVQHDVGAWACPTCGRPLDPKTWKSGEPHGDCAFFHEHPRIPALAEAVRQGIIGGVLDGGGTTTPLLEVIGPDESDVPTPHDLLEDE